MLKKSKIVICLLCMVSLVLLFPIESRAAVYEEYLDYAEPSTSDTQGYLVVYWKNDINGKYSTETYFWYTNSSANGNTAPCYMAITINDNTVRFSPGGVSGTNPYYSLSVIDWQTKYQMLKYSSTEAFTVGPFPNNHIVAFMYSGNVGQVTSNITNQSFTVYWNEDASALKLQAIYEQLVKSNSLTQQEIAELQKIYNQQMSTNGKLDAVVNWLDALNTKTQRTNNWLENIYNLLDKQQEKEKEEATTQGNSSISSGTSNIDDKGVSFGESLGGLVSSLSYSGTDCTWTFPQVKLPGIPGVMSETVLIQQQPINFGEWINKIPGDILLLIQSFSTCALIVYCFKELYSTISYALTLKGGGADE